MYICTHNTCGWLSSAGISNLIAVVVFDQADDNKVISGSYDQTLKIWDIKTGQCQKTLR